MTATPSSHCSRRSRPTLRFAIRARGRFPSATRPPESDRQPPPTSCPSARRPLRDRFGQHYHLDFYTHGELIQIIQRSAQLLAIRIDSEGALELATRSRGTPRIANRLLRRVRDFAQVNELPIVTREVALGASELLEIDACGFDKMDRAILAAIIDKFNGGPVGVETLAGAVGEEADTIGEVYEPYLLQEGFIARTARGRVATARAYSHLGRSRRGTLF